MRLLVISNLYPPNVQGGYEILCAQAVELLRARGHDVRVLTSSEDGIARGVGVEPGPDGVVRRLGLTGRFPEPVKRGRFRALRLHVMNARIARDVIQAYQPDHIFIWSQLRLTLGCAESSERSGLPVSYTFNDDHPAGYLPEASSRSLRALLRKGRDGLFRRTTLATRRLAHTTCISATLKTELLRRGVRIENSKVIFQGIPIERFPPSLDRTHSDIFRVLYVGQLHAYKGVHTLLEAATRLRTTDAFPFSITIAGDGPIEYRQRLRDLAATVDAPVSFLGRVAHGAIPELYRSHDLLVFPSIWKEPFGLTHLEAMASGTPVASTTEGGPAEFLEDGVNALTFKAGDAEDLARAIRRFATDAELRNRVARAARAMVETRFTLDRYVSDLESFLGEAA